MEGGFFYDVGYFLLGKSVYQQNPIMICAKAYAIQHIYRQSGKGEIVR